MSVHRLTLGDVLGEHRRGRPLGTAVVDGDVRLTYPELDDRVGRLAGALAADGVGAGARVLWLGQNSFRVLEMLLACGRLGAIFCPANWRQSPDELAHVLDDLAPAVVVWEESEAVEKARGQVSLDARWVASGEEYEAYVRAALPAPETEVPADSPVLALYTAAFDGRPNAALLSHSALIAHSMALLHVRQMEDGFTFLACGPLFHVGTMMFTLATFQIGGTLVFTPAYEPAEVCRLIEAERCTQAFLFGPMIDGLVEANKDRAHDLSSLRFVSHSPEWDKMITVDDSPWCASRMGGYGQTEVGGMLTFLGLGMGGAGYAGRSSPLVHVRLLDAEGNEVGPGEVGEICARGLSLFSGLLEPAGAERGEDGGRLAPHRGPGAPRAGRHDHLHRPPPPHDQVGEREHLPGRGRARAEVPSRDRRRRRDRRPRRPLRPVAQGRGRAGGRRLGHRRGDHRACPR